MREKCCVFKKDGCPFPSHSAAICLKNDEKGCTMARILKEKKELRISARTDYERDPK